MQKGLTRIGIGSGQGKLIGNDDRRKVHKRKEKLGIKPLKMGRVKEGKKDEEKEETETKKRKDQKVIVRSEQESDTEETSEEEETQEKISSPEMEVIGEEEAGEIDYGLAIQNLADQQIESQCELEGEIELDASDEEQQDVEYLRCDYTGSIFHV